MLLAEGEIQDWARANKPEVVTESDVTTSALMDSEIERKDPLPSHSLTSQL